LEAANVNESRGLVRYTRRMSEEDFFKCGVL